MNKTIYLTAIAFSLVVLAVCISHCNKKQHRAAATVGKNETTTLIMGHADTTTHFQKIRGAVRLRKLQHTSSDSISIYTGSINDSLADVSVTAHVSNDSTFIDLDFAGAIAEKIISRTDTLLHTTLEVQETKSPWYDSFATGIITAGVVFVIYIIFHTAL
jgi:hypothetical protein